MKVADWNRIRAKLKKKFAAVGLTFCEECGRHDYLSFAHRYKRRFITDEKELEVVALLCMDNPEAKGCHNILEVSGHQNMYDRINEIIARRDVTI